MMPRTRTAFILVNVKQSGTIKVKDLFQKLSHTSQIEIRCGAQQTHFMFGTVQNFQNIVGTSKCFYLPFNSVQGHYLEAVSYKTFFFSYWN